MLEIISCSILSIYVFAPVYNFVLYDVSLYAFPFLLPIIFSRCKHTEKGRSTINQFIELSRGYSSRMHSH